MTTKRELILQDIVSTLQRECTLIKTVTRDLIKDMKELMQYPQTHLPVAAVIGSLPETEPHISSQGGKGGLPMKFNSTLTVSIYVYFNSNKEPDTVLSEIANDLWKALFKETTRNGNAVKTTISPDPGVGRLGSSYYGFVFNVKVNYIHGTDSI